MAGTATLKIADSTHHKVGVEIYKATLGAADTTVVITPSNIKAIYNVEVEPLTAASCAAGIPFLTTFAPGDATVTITGANTTSYLVKIEGKI